MRSTGDASALFVIPGTPSPFKVRAPCQDALGRWWLSGMSDVRGVLNDPGSLVDISVERQTKRISEALGRSYPHLNNVFSLLAFTNGVQHQALRSEAAKLVQAMSKNLLLDKLVDPLSDVTWPQNEFGHEFDGIKDVIDPCLNSWRAHLLGITPAQSKTIGDLSDAMMCGVSRGLSHSGPKKLDAAVAKVEQAYCAALAGDSAALQSEDFARIAIFFVAISALGGFCANMLDVLAKDQPLQDRLRAEPSLLPSFLIEAERYCVVTRFLMREIGAQGLQLSDLYLPAGARVVLDLGSASRDPAIWDNPNQFDMARKRMPNLAFSEGAHRCMGIQATRRFVPKFLELLLNRYRIRPGDTETEWTDNWFFHNPRTLPLYFERC